MNEFAQCPTEGAIGLLNLLIQSGRLAESRLDAALAEAGLTFAKWRTLDTLKKAVEPLPLKALTERLGCVKSNVTQMVDRLEADGTVRRTPEPHDRRSMLTELTPAGVEAHAAGRHALESATRAVFARFDDDDRAALRCVLGLLGSE